MPAVRQNESQMIIYIDIISFDPAETIAKLISIPGRFLVALFGKSGDG